jgi:hypothetical protein
MDGWYRTGNYAGRPAASRAAKRLLRYLDDVSPGIRYLGVVIVIFVLAKLFLIVAFFPRKFTVFALKRHVKFRVVLERGPLKHKLWKGSDYLFHNLIREVVLNIELNPKHTLLSCKISV